MKSCFEIRTSVEEGILWFVAKDIAEALDIVWRGRIASLALEKNGKGSGLT